MTGITGWLAGVLITGMLHGDSLGGIRRSASLGQNAAAVSGSVKGSQVRDYRFEGREGEQARRRSASALFPAVENDCCWRPCRLLKLATGWGFCLPTAAMCARKQRPY